MLERFRIVDGRLSGDASDFTGEANFYGGCESCPGGNSSHEPWCEWVLTFETGRLVWARTVENGLPWGYLEPDAELAAAIEALRPFGLEKTMVAFDQLLTPPK